MKNLQRITLVAVLLAAVAVLAVTISGQAPAQAQNRVRFEYAKIMCVGNANSYETELNRWAAREEPKEFLTSRVFVYEAGQTQHEERYNMLKLLDKLGEQGWELIDADRGILKRTR